MTPNRPFVSVKFNNRALTNQHDHHNAAFYPMIIVIFIKESDENVCSTAQHNALGY